MLDWLSWSKRRCLEKHRASFTPKDHWSESLCRYMSTPLPDLNKPVSEHDFVALDFETTGLNFEQDKILSVGCVSLTSEVVDVSSSLEVYVNNSEHVNSTSAQVNGITRQMAAAGTELTTAFDHLLEEMRGKIVLAHNACIEKEFINQFTRNAYQIDNFPCYFMDTLAIEKRFSYAAKTKQHTSYQLNDLRRHYKLPDYHAHSAASDAAACAELFLVQLKKLKFAQRASIKKLVQ